MVEDPSRLCDEGGSELMRSLLSAAREERPSPAAITRTLLVVGAGTAAATLAGTGSAAGALSNLGAASAATALGTSKGAVAASLVVLKWLSAGLVAGLVGAYAVSRMTPPAAPAVETKVAETARARQPVLTRPRVAAATTAALSAEAPEVLPTPKVLPSASVGPSPSVTAALASVPAEVDPDAQLAAELVLLDRARQALAAGEASAALRALNDYDARFAHPNLLPEALYLRLEAFTVQGNRPGAELVARRMLRSFPRGPHAARARAELGLEK